MSLLSNVSDEEFKKIVSESYSLKEVGKELGYTGYSGKLSNLIKERCCNLNLDLSHFIALNRQKIERNFENIFCENSTADQKTLRKYYKRLTEEEYFCSICGQLPQWNGKELTLILDHINGINKDDRLENLHWVCPNCNMQLDTTNGKNNKKI